MIWIYASAIAIVGLILSTKTEKWFRKRKDLAIYLYTVLATLVGVVIALQLTNNQNEKDRHERMIRYLVSVREIISSYKFSTINGLKAFIKNQDYIKSVDTSFFGFYVYKKNGFEFPKVIHQITNDENIMTYISRESLREFLVIEFNLRSAETGFDEKPVPNSEVVNHLNQLDNLSDILMQTIDYEIAYQKGDRTAEENQEFYTERQRKTIEGWKETLERQKKENNLKR